MSDIFLSYASDDRDRVRPVVKVLEEYGWSVWWDRRILPGESWPDVIEDALKDCRAMVVVWTEASVESRWVRLEARAGQRINGLVPIMLDHRPPPLEFSDLQAADLSSWDERGPHPEFSLAIEALQRILGPSDEHGSADARPATLGSDSQFTVSLAVGGDLGSTDWKDQRYISEQVRAAGKSAVPALLAALEFPDARRRGHAAYLLGLTGETDLVDELVPLLEDREEVGIVDWLPTVRAAAVLALKNIGTLEALQALAEAFE